VLKSRDPACASRDLLEVSKRLSAQTTNPTLLADCAETLLANGRKTEAEKMYRDLIRWNPRALQKDRALAAIGRIEMDRGNDKAALEQFDRFQREVPGSRLFGEVMLARGELLQKAGRTKEAREAFESLLSHEYALGQQKAKALYLIGQLYMNEERPDLAIPYFQRLYVMHGRWREWVEGVLSQRRGFRETQ
jgi:tetratricopeptide (TPR) repeat protein